MKNRHILRELSFADAITLLGTLLIIVAIWLLWRGQVNLAISIAFVSMFFDYLDGSIARKYGGSAYGKVLDTLYDILGFVLFPSLVVLLKSNWLWWVLPITALYHLSATLRLARFTTQGYMEASKRYYIGLPVLYSKYALLISFIANAKVSAIILAIMVPLMISSKPVKKPHPLFAYFNLLYAVIYFVLYLR
jgi:CDP-diacylglycerol--serine O-phosphatidyltransferase